VGGDRLSRPLAGLWRRLVGPQAHAARGQKPRMSRRKPDVEESRMSLILNLFRARLVVSRVSEPRWV